MTRCCSNCNKVPSMQGDDPTGTSMLQFFSTAETMPKRARSLCTLIPNKKQSSHQKSTGSKLKFVNNTVSKSGAFPRLHTQFLQMSVRCMSNFQSEGCVSNWISNPSHFQPSCLHRLNQKHLCTGPEGSS